MRGTIRRKAGEGGVVLNPRLVSRIDTAFELIAESLVTRNRGAVYENGIDLGVAKSINCCLSPTICTISKVSTTGSEGLTDDLRFLNKAESQRIFHPYWSIILLYSLSHIHS